MGGEPATGSDATVEAGSLVRSERADEELARFRAALARDPSDLDARRGVARSLLRIRDVDAAREQYEEVLARAPEDVGALTGLGTCALKAGDPESAIVLLRTAQRCRPGHISSAVKLADALTATGESDEALRVLQAACHVHPNASRLRVALARLHADRDEPERAMDALMALETLPRGDSSESYAAARTWMRIGQHERALPLLEGMLSAGTAGWEGTAATAMIEALLALGRWERALAFAASVAPDGLRTFAPGSGRAPDEPVPALIHQYWEPGGLPDEYRVRSDEWQRRNPDCIQRLWGADEAEALLAGISDEAVRAFRSLRHPAMRADLFRYAVLLREGGVYLDANLTAAAPLRTTVLAMPGFHVTAGKNSVGRPLERMSVRNDFIASPVGHPIVRDALTTSVRNVLERSASSLIALAGPPVLSEAFRAVVHMSREGAGTLHVWETHRAQCLRGSLPRPAGQEESHWSRLTFEAGFLEAAGDGGRARVRSSRPSPDRSSGGR